MGNVAVFAGFAVSIAGILAGDRRMANRRASGIAVFAAISECVAIDILVVRM